VANPYVMRGKELDVVSGARSLVVLSKAIYPKAAIRQLPPPRVLLPIIKVGG